MSGERGIVQEYVARSLTRDRFSVFVLGAFACLASILAAVGLDGVVAYVVTQRTNEIGIRIALGAEPRGIQRLVVVQSLRMLLIGLGLGLVGAVDDQLRRPLLQLAVQHARASIDVIATYVMAMVSPPASVR